MTSEFQTTVTGPGTIKFYYKKNAGTNDYFRFKVDGDIKLPIANSSASWTYYPYNVTGAGSHTIQWHYSKGGSGTTANGGVWVDLVEWDPDDDSDPTLAEALDCEYTITTGGDDDWYGDASSAAYFGGDVATHPTISDSEQTYMQTTVTASAGDYATFYWKVSS